MALTNPFLEPRHARILEEARRASGPWSTLERIAAKDVGEAGRTAIRRLAGAGLLRHAVPRAHGGASESVEVRSLVAAREGVAHGSGLADAMLALQGLGSLTLTLHGTDAQKKQWLPRVATGRAIAAFAVTEPEAGSDVASMTTRATKTRTGWEITGAKTLISNAGIADYYTLFAKTDPGAGAKGISAFLVPALARGLSARPLDLMAPHPIGSVQLRRVRVPGDALIGVEGEGYKLALATLDRMRPTVAAAALGMAQRALEEAVAYVATRKQFGRPIADNQGPRWQLAEAATKLEAARLLVYKAAWLKDKGQERITFEGAQAKLLATETAQRVIDTAMQLHGGAGQLAGSVVERLYREVRALRIYEGSSEILKDVIGRTLVSAS